MQNSQITLESIKRLWLEGRWEEIIEFNTLNTDNLSRDAELALFLASAYQNIGQCGLASEWISYAKKKGCNNTLLAKVCISDLQNTLACIAALNNSEQEAHSHFSAAVSALSSDELDLFSHARNVREMARLGLLPQAANLIKEKLEEKNIETMIFILKTELDLLTHELSLAHQRQQLYIVENNNDSTRSLEIGTIEYIADLEKKSVSQLGQDLWILKKTNYKRGGFFVEFGATDGVLLSNTYLLEKEFGWKGICAEPNPKFYEKLKKNRSCVVSDACIAGKTGEIVNFILAEEYGSIEKYADSDMHKEKREAYKKNDQVIQLDTISLHDFLIKNNVPKEIDYLSIDTEGSELEILMNFPFHEWNVKILTVEHNYTEQRGEIFNILSLNGYIRKEKEWDDWYFREN